MLSVVIPAHNESGSLPGLLTEVCQLLEGIIPFEIVVVDDGSTDNSRQILQDLDHRIPELRVLRHRDSCGQSTALMTGVDAAAGALIATLDGDGQNDPADLLPMVDLIREYPAPMAMVVGHRTHRRDSTWRWVCSRIANAVRSRLLGDSTPDSGCGIKVFYRDAFQRLPRFDHMHRFLPALMRRAGGVVVSLPVRHRPRFSGRSHYGTLGRLMAGIVDLAGVAWLMLRTRHPEMEQPTEFRPLRVAERKQASHDN